jgi:hypothetical protein
MPITSQVRAVTINPSYMIGTTPCEKAAAEGRLVEVKPGMVTADGSVSRQTEQAGDHLAYDVVGGICIINLTKKYVEVDSMRASSGWHFALTPQFQLETIRDALADFRQHRPCDARIALRTRLRSRNASANK